MSDNEYIRMRIRQIEAFERSYGRPRQRLFQPDGAKPMLTHANETIEQPRQRQAREPVLPAVKPTQVPTPAPAPASLLDIIFHAGSDPNFDVEKFRALVSIQREEQDRQDARADRAAELAAEAAFNAALTAVQRKMTAVRATIENTQTRSLYADYAALDRMLRPIYSEADFALTYGEEDCPKPDHVRVFCLVTHSPAGAKRSFTRKYHVDMAADGKGARGGDVMTRTHATKSAFTYSQGALIRMIFNIAVSKDDDGNAATAARPAQTESLPGTISAAQASEIRRLLDDRGIVHRAFLQFIRLPRIEDIGVEHFDRAVAKIKGMGRKS
jgi:hypothetical protein